MPDKTVRDELASLTEAVRELRDDEVAAELRRLRAEVEHLRAERATHHCTGCSCMHVHWYPNYQPFPSVPGCAPQPTHVWYSTITSGSGGTFGSTTDTRATSAAVTNLPGGVTVTGAGVGSYTVTAVN